MKNKLCLLPFILILTSLTTGCSTAKGTAFKDHSELMNYSDDSAKVVVFRPSKFTGALATMNVQANQKTMGELLPAGYITFKVPEGEVILNTDTGGIDRRYKLQAEKNTVYYFKTDFDNYVFAGAWDLEPVTREYVTKELAHLKNSKP